MAGGDESWSHADWILVLSARAAIIGHEVAQHLESVELFRRHFKDGLLPPDEKKISAWLDREAQRGNALKPSSGDPAEALGLSGLATAMRQPHRRMAPNRVPDPIAYPKVKLLLEVASRHERSLIWVKEVMPYGVLGELYWLGLYLQGEFGWEPNYARGWAISRDAYPIVFPIKVRHRTPPVVEAPNAYRHRILLDVAVDIPPARLEQEFRDIQSNVKTKWALPAKPIAEWNLRATVFAVWRNDGRAWGDVVDAWNESVKESSWKYEDSVEGAHLFGKTVRRTYRALIGKPMKWKRKPAQHRTK